MTTTMLCTIGMIVVYILIMLGIGFYTSRKTKSVSDFVLGGRTAGSWLTAFAYGTSYFSAVVFIGYAGQFGWNYGVSAAWIGVGNAVIGSLLAWVVLGRRTRIMTKHLGSKTMPEFFENRFQSKSLKIAAAAIVFVFLIPYTASVYNGLSRLFAMAFNLTSDTSYMVIIVAMALLTAVYVILGGYAATAINDFVQGLVMLAGIAAVVYCVIHNQGGFSSALEGLKNIDTNGAKAGTLNTLFGPDPINLFGVVVLTSLGTWGLPQMVHKFYAIKDQDAVKKGTIISTVFALIVAGGSYLLGGFDRLFCTTDAADASGKTLIATLPNGKPEFDAMIPAVLQTALPDLLIGLVVVLVLSASMSTLSSLVLTSSSTLTIDMIKPAMKKTMSDNKEVTVMRILIGAFLLVSVLIAFNKTASISTLMSYSWGALAGAFLGPFMWGLFSKKVTKAAVWTSFATGIVGTVTHMCIFSFFSSSFPGLVKAAVSCPLNLASPINAGAILMVLSIIIVPVVSAFTKPCDQKAVDAVFACYDEKNA
ncbi:sodium:solute symporter family protein [Ruminococcus sp.]|uniref:sodium:solute symporter family protein n=1 Tax=Ruminococcus sp. TaxID=41978 RepID=UPI003EFE0DA0